MMSRSALFAMSGGLFHGEGVVRIGVQIRAQLVRRDLPVKGLSDRQDVLGGRHFAFSLVKPFPYVLLTNLRARDQWANSTGKLRLSASQFNRPN